jgi:hypothetical protein
MQKSTMALNLLGWIMNSSTKMISIKNQLQFTNHSDCPMCWFKNAIEVKYCPKFMFTGGVGEHLSPC